METKESLSQIEKAIYNVTDDVLRDSIHGCVKRFINDLQENDIDEEFNWADILYRLINLNRSRWRQKRLEIVTQQSNYPNNLKDVLNDINSFFNTVSELEKEENFSLAKEFIVSHAKNLKNKISEIKTDQKNLTSINSFHNSLNLLKVS